MKAYKIKYKCGSHIGNIRSINQDNYICDRRYMVINESQIYHEFSGCSNSENNPLFAVFDGMGGEEHGEIAAYIAAKTASVISIGEDPETDLNNYCIDANEYICRYADESDMISMGTTAAMLLFAQDNLIICNIGDSKVFQLSGGCFNQISVDHISALSCGTKPPLTQNLGIPPQEMMITPYIKPVSFHINDVFLICSDGLTDMVSNSVICDIISNNSINNAYRLLLNTALDNGGKDNITIILCEVLD